MVGVAKQVASDDRHMRVLRYEQGLEASLLHHLGQVTDGQVQVR